MGLKLAANMRALLTALKTHPGLVWGITTGILQHDIPSDIPPLSYRNFREWPPFGGRADHRAICSNGSMLAVAAERRWVNIWDLKAHSATPRDFVLGPFQCIGYIDLTTESKSLYISDLWSTGQRQWFHEHSSLSVNKFKIPSDEKTGVAFSPLEALFVDQVKPTLLDSTSQKTSVGVYFGWTTDRTGIIIWTGQAICIIFDVTRSDEEKRTSVGNRVVITLDDSEFAILDFNNRRINEI